MLALVLRRRPCPRLAFLLTHWLEPLRFEHPHLVALHRGWFVQASHSFHPIRVAKQGEGRGISSDTLKRSREPKAYKRIFSEAERHEIRPRRSVLSSPLTLWHRSQSRRQVERQTHRQTCLRKMVGKTKSNCSRDQALELELPH